MSSIDYDVIIFGSGTGAIHAAKVAASWQARVAWVKSAQDKSQQWMHAGVLLAIQSALVGRSPLSAQESVSSRRSQLHDSLAQSALVDATQDTWDSDAELLALGVDVIPGTGEFFRRPTLGVRVGDRQLRSRRYLLAPCLQLVPLTVPGLEEISYHTPETIWRSLPTLPPGRTWLVWADSLEGIEIAQAIARLGETVTLLTPHQVLVPAASLAVNQVLQASLEAHGVAIWTSQSIQSVAKVGDELHIQGSDRPFDAQELIVTGSYQPQLDGYNLEAVGLSPTGLDVDPHGRTRHPRVYACLGLHAGEPNPSLARNQAEQAIAHGLGWPIPRPKPMPALHILRTDPELAYGGMSEAAIHLRYGSKVHCLRYPFKQLAIAHFWNQTTGFCQLWVHPQGYILRVEIVGLQAADLAGIVAIAIHQRLPISTLGRLPTLPTMAQSLFSQIALTWQQQWGDRHPQWRDWLESWLIWQRDWSR